MPVTTYVMAASLCVLAILLYLHFSTSLDYTRTSLEPISLYYSVTRNTKNSNSSGQKYPIKCVEFTIVDLFKGAYDEKFLKDERSHLSIYKSYQGKYNEIRIKFSDFKKESNFWDKTGNNFEKYNSARVEKYIHDTIPDLLISAPFVQDNILPIWTQVSQSQPGMAIDATPFLRQTSFSTWECKYFFDTKFSGTRYKGETYLRVDVEYLLFEVLIPDRFKIVNFEDVQLEKISGGYLLRKKLEGGRSFHLILQHQTRETIKTVIGFISPALFGTIFGMFINKWLRF